MRVIIEYASKAYPERLRYISNPPSRLYVEGNYKILEKLGISVIGSRTNTQYGEKMCKTFIKDLMKYDINIISGLAIGIDGIAHKTCLKNNGTTIAVLPSGLDNIFPDKHKQLAKDIVENGGVLISEYENSVKADSKKFLERNRIVAGLGIGTLVVEAGAKSGTRVTARLTKQYGKPVFCIPSSLENIKGKTTNELIQKGAELVTSAEDIINYYKEIKFSKKEKIIKEVYIDIPKDLISVYKNITNTPQDINEIARKSNLSVSEVNYKTTMLQMEDLIIELPGQRFVRNNEIQE